VQASKNGVAVHPFSKNARKFLISPKQKIKYFGRTDGLRPLIVGW
jgi:hypothetical protein